MKTTALTLNFDQLFFLAQDLIKPQLNRPSLVEDYCSDFCEDEAELSEQIAWRLKMLQELESIEPIASINNNIQRIVEEIL